MPTAHIVLRAAGSDGPSAWEGLADQDGEFRSTPIGMGVYDLFVQALGYAPITHQLTFTGDGGIEAEIRMSPTAIALEGVVVTAIRPSKLESNGFYERRKMGIGHSLTREDIEARGTTRASELFQGIPGVRVISPRVGVAGDIRLRGGCRPMYVVDGTPVTIPIAVDELLQVGDIEALEIYHGSSGPVQSLRYNCGTVMAWTREVDRVEGTPFSWRKFFTALGLVSFLALIAPH
jgi:hypothetical protein